jgi:hypothetical protein
MPMLTWAYIRAVTASESKIEEVNKAIAISFALPIKEAI